MLGKILYVVDKDVSTSWKWPIQSKPVVKGAKYWQQKFLFAIMVYFIAAYITTEECVE